MPTEDKVSGDRRRQMIAEAAYFRSARRGLNDGDAVRDWCEAEAEIDARLRDDERAQWRERLEESLRQASKKLASVRRKAANLSAVARAEWQRDIDRLAELRDALKPKLAELETQGERAGQKLREQAERMRAEIAELIRAFEAKAKR